MSLVPRVLGAHSGKKKKPSASWRRPVLIFIFLLALVLLGTVIVLSSVKAYFGVPASAFITEREVPWIDGRDAIKPLTPWVEEGEAADAPNTARSESWQRDDFVTETFVDEQLAVVEDELDLTPGGPEPEPVEIESLGDFEPVDFVDSESSATTWGPDGKGTGGYWMRQDWDGRVEGTHSWDHLYNVTLKYVLVGESASDKK